ncbi:MAG: flavin reductase [Xanthomonadales bacterium]|nr:flavin reductase family protein [Gammaproteobacteria bacterium]MBT8051375.1 flavin reductase family protein [Gammaproteobacteria bacterium]MBT8056923.1 flavin reductase family protein [Gammaproteobacteria bacterium]NNJ78886.1 flavin reductase [Xanthomonadales bacterium]NNL05943.1 flavin reductase [Xanthomonadales bacterium]
MQHPAEQQKLVELDTSQPVWDRFFWVAPLVLIGTLEEDGGHDLAPKHMAFPLGWDNYYAFVCTPRHHTYSNLKRTGVFTVSYPRPTQLVMTSLAAAPRYEHDEKPSLLALPVFPATKVAGVLLESGSAFLECELDRLIDGFGENSLVVGRVVAARVAEDAARHGDGDDQSLVHQAPLLAYLNPGRFATINDSLSYPFPSGMKK